MHFSDSLFGVFTRNFSLFATFFRQEFYKKVYPFWKYPLQNPFGGGIILP